jgi:signal transduction histidine kinase
MRLLCFFFLIIICPFTGIAGNKYTGTQHKLLLQLHDSALYFKDLLPARAQTFINQGINISKSLENDSAQAKFLELLAFTSYRESNYTLAIKHYREALKLRKSLKQYPEILTSLILIGQMHEKQGEYTEAQNIYFEALKSAEKYKLPYYKAKSLYSLGSLYLLMQHYVPAANYLNKCKELCIQSNNNEGLGKVLDGLGSLFMRQHNFDSAEYYYKQAILSHQKMGNKEGLSIDYTNLATLYEGREMYNKALEYYEKSCELYKSLPVQEGTAIAFLNLGVCYHDMGQYKKALIYLKQAETLANELQIPHVITVVYYNISSAYEELGDLKPALKYAQMYSDLKDTLFTEESNKQIVEMRQKYEAEKSEQKIERLQTEKALEESKLTVRTQQRNLLFLSAVILFVLAAFVMFSFRQKLNLNKIKAQQAEEENRKAINNLLKEQEINAVSAMIQGQEQERQRVAEDLHDRLGSLLSTVKLNFGSLEKKLNTGLTGAEQYKKGIYLLDEACSEVRKIAYNMASGVLQKYGFVTALEELKTSIESSNTIQVHFYKYNIEQPVDKDTEINLYRITQELISNILKHAGATEIHIQYSIIQDTINLIVEDNGRGFDAVKNTGTKGMGIGNIHARVSKLDGTIDFDSSIGRGTIVIINIPVKNTSLVPTINQPA